MTPLQEIEKDLDWRESELAILKIHLANEGISSRERLVLFRAGWALLYAHYEGFFKFVLTVYYDAVERSGKCHKDLPMQMQAFALDKHLKNVRSLPTSELIEKIGSFDGDVMSNAPCFPDVDTESNLWPSTLQNLLDQADINLASLAQSNRTIATLVSRRNKIAHGERDIIPEYSYYVQFEEAVRTLMYDLAISVDDRLKAL